MKKFNLLLLFTILGSFIFAQTTAALDTELHQEKTAIPISDDACFQKAEQCYYKTLAEFKATFSPSDFDEKLSSQAYCYYLDKNWIALEKFFTDNKLNNAWPPCSGGYDTKNDIALKAGMKFDRYGNAISIDNNIPILAGTFTSPYIDGKPYAFEARALNNKRESYAFYYEIEILKDLDFTGQEASIIPWFGQEGNGIQINWNIPKDPTSGYNKTWNKLAEEGYIRITIIDTPSGEFITMKGLTIPTKPTTKEKDNTKIKKKK